MIRRPQPHNSSRWFNKILGQPMDEVSKHDRLCIPEEDLTLDAFDRELLAESSDENFWEEVQDRYKTPLPYPLASLADDSRSRNSRDTLPRRVDSPAASSSTTRPFSSPTPAARSNMIARNTQMGDSGHSDVPNTSTKSSIPKLRTATKVSNPHSFVIEPRESTPIVQGIRLIETSRLPDSIRSIFKFPIFNAVQSKCFPHAYHGSDNIVLSAPTGSGKTAVMELAICQLLMTQKSGQFKVVYQAPTKSLCNERYRDWTAKFNTLGLRCAELTGDVEFAHLRNVQSANIIIATPEKWDSITRKWKDNAKLVQMIKLFLVDEVHILKESRGATLEAVVSRMKSVGCGVRFVALSATVPNSDDVATWLGRNCNMPERPAIREVFGEDFRPVILEKHVLGYRSTGNDFVLDNILTKEIPAVISRYARRKPVMVFCATRRSASKTAIMLADLWKATAPGSRLWDSPKEYIRVTDHELQDILPTGVAFHHSGLDAVDRQAIETGYLDGQISVICSTSTLAVGVNLPCYLVILKGTVSYTDTGLQEYSSLEIMQMLGRAGRPQFETSACAIILTSHEKMCRYEKLISGHELLESCLHQNLIEHLNAEIGTGTVRDLESAKKWLTSTFLYIRMRKNPEHYQIAGGSAFEDEETLLQNLCKKDIRLLEEAQLVEEVDTVLRSTEIGNVMTRFYVRYETMRIFGSLSPNAKVSEILSALSQAHEFHELRWRSGEKSVFKRINKSTDVRYPIKVDIALPAHKASLIVQIELGGLALEKEDAKKHATQLRQDTMMVLSHFRRLIRCIIDMQVVFGDGTAVRNALELGRGLAAGVWDDTPMQLKQLSGIGEVAVRKLASAGIKSIGILSNTEPHRLDLILGKAQPFGANLLKRVAAFPQLRVAVKEVSKKRQKGQGTKVQFRCEVGFLNDSVPAFFNQKPVYVIFLCETSNGTIIDFRRFSVKNLTNGEDILLAALLKQPTAHISCRVMCDEVAGTHQYAELKLNISNSWFPPQNDVARLADEQRLPGPGNTQCASDEFDDGGLADDDFIVSEKRITQANMAVMDIDNVMPGQAQTPILTPGIKRKISSNSRTDDAQDAKHRLEPMKLANGNWTCQHTCNRDGKVCQHRCCKVGVKRPRKKQRTSDDQAPVDKEECKVASTTQHRTGRVNPHLGKGPIVDFLKASTKIESGFDTNGQEQNRHQSLSSINRIPKPPDRLPLVNGVKTALESSQVPSKCTSLTAYSQSDDRYGPEDVDDWDALDFEQFDPVDCDWNVGTLDLAILPDVVKDVEPRSEFPQSPVQRMLPHGKVLDQINAGMSMEPKSFNRCVASTSSLDKLLLSEISSASGELSSCLALDGKEVDCYDQTSHDHEFTDLDNSRPPHLSPIETKPLSMSLGVPTDTGSRCSRNCVPPSRLEGSSTPQEQILKSKTETNSHSYREDQLKKWEGLDPLMFEEFGAYVELI